MVIYEIFLMRKRVLNVKHSEINSFWRLTKAPADHFSYQFLSKSRIFNVQPKLLVFQPFRPFIQGPTNFRVHRWCLKNGWSNGWQHFTFCTVRYTDWWFGLWDFFGKFDWDIFDEITSNIGVITLVAFSAAGGGPKNASGESLFNQKKYW